MIERDRRQSVYRMPRGVAGKRRIEVARHEAEVSRCELPLVRDALRFAQRLQLLEVRELADVHLRGEVAADRLLKRLVRLEVAAGQRPAACERLLRALPEQHLQPAGANLEDDGQRDVGRGGMARVRLGLRFSPHSRKP